MNHSQETLIYLNVSVYCGNNNNHLVNCKMAQTVMAVRVLVRQLEVIWGSASWPRVLGMEWCQKDGRPRSTSCH